MPLYISSNVYNVIWNANTIVIRSFLGYVFMPLNIVLLCYYNVTDAENGFQVISNVGPGRADIRGARLCAIPDVQR